MEYHPHTYGVSPLYLWGIPRIPVEYLPHTYGVSTTPLCSTWGIPPITPFRNKRDRFYPMISLPYQGTFPQNPALLAPPTPTRGIPWTYYHITLHPIDMYPIPPPPIASPADTQCQTGGCSMPVRRILNARPADTQCQPGGYLMSAR